MKQRSGFSYLSLILAAAAVIGLTFMAMVALALLGYSSEQQAESIPAKIAEAGHWQVVSLPPHWKQYYSEAEFEQLRQTMQELVEKYKLPADEFMGLLDVESGGNPRVCSEAGAIGLGQFMAGTARGFSEFGPLASRVENRCNPIMSMRASARKLATDRACHGGADWGTLKLAYLGSSKRDCFAYNPGAPEATWSKIASRAAEFRQKGYVSQTGTLASGPSSCGGSVDTQTGYALPFPRSYLVNVTQAGRHENENVDDIIMPNGTPLCALGSARVTGRVINRTHVPFPSGAASCGSSIEYQLTAGPWQGSSLRYCHMEPDSFPAGLAVGSQVSAGQFVGRSNNTGRTTGPHLHLEVSNRGHGEIVRLLRSLGQ